MDKKKSEELIQKDISCEDVSTWELPDGAIARLGRGREPDIAFSPDGQYIGIGTSLGLWLYDQETLLPIALWETERGMIGKIVFSPNGKWIAVSNSDQILKILDIQNGVCLAKVKTGDYISGLTFSQDNKYLAVAHACTSIVEVFHTENCEISVKLTANTDTAGFYRPICFSPDTQLIVCTYRDDTTDNPEAIVVWDVEKGQQITSLNKHTRYITTLCFSPCGKNLASGAEDGSVYVWDVDTWQQVEEYINYGEVYGIIPSYTPDGILHAVIDTYEETGPVTISLHNLESGKLLFTDEVWGNTIEFSGTFDWGNTIVFSNGSQLAYEQRHSYINVWINKNPFKRQFTHSPISFPKSATFSLDGKTLAIEYHHEGAILWDIATKSSRPAMTAETVGKNQFVYKTRDGKLFAASIHEDTVTLWETDGNVPLLKGTGRKYWSAFPVLAPTGSLFAYADEDGNLKVWDVQNGEKLYELTHPLYKDKDGEDEDDKDEIRKLTFSHDGTLLASESRFTTVRLWDMQQGKEIEGFPGDSVLGIIGFSPYGKHLACYGEEIKLWDIQLCQFRQTGLNDGPYGFIEFSPCGKYLACNGEDNILHIFDLTRFETYKRIPLSIESDQLLAAAFSSCGQYLAAGTWWTEGMEKMLIYLWEVETGRCITTFCGHPTDIQALAISHDNKLLASASYDGSILI